ncbi:MAG: 4Fe-4S binding protein [Deltaproteobacteria bacterium]|nr:4Fe-4S binding protein [Deltaproteobacteria bacterium]
MTPKNKIPKQANSKEFPQITIFFDWCKSCGICVAFCPKEVLAMDENRKVFTKAPEKCIACHMCELRCPDFAINVKEVEKQPALTEDNNNE